ncbi:MAG: glutamate racemase [Anaerolineae bacterium]|jgi:glutamate racemase
MTNGDAIGVFDSGVGGLSVWREIARQIPVANLVYFADQAHVPYGARPMSQIREYSTAITRFLLSQGAQVIVVACNTASAAALYHLRATFPHVPFVGMEPALKPAVETSRNGIVGVIATVATFQGQLFASLVERFANDVQVLTQTCPGLVGAVEAGELDSAATEALLHDSLSALTAARIDTLVLGCTHYPFLTPLIAHIVGPDVNIVDPAPAVARQTARVWAKIGGEKGAGRRVFYTSGDPSPLSALITRLFDETPKVRPAAWQAGRLTA